MAASSRLRTASLASIGSLFAAASVLGAGCTLDWHLDDAASQDGSAVDGSGADGALEDGPPQGSDGGKLDCDGALLCTDFDDGKITPPFDQNIPNNNALVLHVDSSGLAPHERTLDALRQATGPPSAYTQTKNYPQTLTAASIVVDVMPLQIASGRACIVGLIFGADQAQEHVIRILVGATSAILQNRTPTATAGTYGLSRTLAANQWTTVSMSADVEGHVVVRFGSDTVLQTTVGALGTSSTSTRAFIGINFVDTPGGPYELRFDNVRVDGH